MFEQKPDYFFSMSVTFPNTAECLQVVIVRKPGGKW